MFEVLRDDTGVVTIELGHRLDGEAADGLRALVERLAFEQPTRVVLDLRHTTFLDGAGLGPLAFLLKRLGARVTLLGATGQPLALLRGLGLAKVLGLQEAPRRAWFFRAKPGAASQARAA